jgi:predicted nucleic acid-binding protein
MAGASLLYYWDTCLFLAWLNDEPRKSGEMDGVRELIARHKRREIRLMTSVLTQVEVLQSRLPVGMGSLFLEVLKRLTRMGMDIKVASLAHDIRDYYLIHSDQHGGKRLSTPDAIHLATAILYRADEFHTFDEKLIPLSGNVGGHDLRICKPEARSPELDLRRT